MKTPVSRGGQIRNQLPLLLWYIVQPHEHGMRLAEQSAKISRGNAVHHPHHGIGRVQSIGKPNFAGSHGANFAQLYFKREDLTLILPMRDAADTVRRPISAAQAAQILDHIEHWDGRASKQWKARAAAHRDAMDRGDPFEYAEVFKTLSRLEAAGGLRHTDRRHLNRALDALADELAFALDETPDRARAQITAAAAAPDSDAE
jgi:RNA polymerase-interacting CarD/CdnL/TRCF family regulator